MVKDKRQSNFELLRVVSMLFIVLSLLLTWGMNYGSQGVLSVSNGYLLNGIAFPFLSALSTLGVICFVLISGYYTCTSNTLSISRIAKTWSITWFYSVLIGGVAFCSQYIQEKDIIPTLFPIGSNQYWFVTKYIALMLLAPFISVLISCLTKNGFLWLVTITAFLTVTITSGIPYGNVLFQDNPLSVATFVFIFIIAAYIRKNGLPTVLEENSGKIFIFFILLQGAIGVLLNGYRPATNAIIGGFSCQYNALSIVPGVALFVWFKNQKFNDDNWLIRFLAGIAPYSFAVYLIHDNPYIRRILWSKIIDCGLYWSSPMWLLLVLVVPIAVYGLCSIIDSVRVLLFKLFFDNLLKKSKRFDVEIK